VTWQVAVAGTVHRDDITTPKGRTTSLGGSALFFAIAASRFARVHVNGIVGSDCRPEVHAVLEGLDVDLDGLEVSELPTFVWHAVHDFDRWVTSSESSEEGCDPTWSTELPPASAVAQVLFLASMRPQFQQRVLGQSRARLVGADSMMVYIDSDATAVRRLMERVDMLFLNEEEVVGLTGIPDWRRAARSLCGAGRLRAAVVSRGPLGAACVTHDMLLERPAVAVDDVVDPTGAGDALAAGFLGFCAEQERDDDASFAAALDAGLVCAAHAVETFGTAGLREFVARESVTGAELHGLDEQ